MRLIYIVAVLVIAGACSHKPSYETFSESSGAFVADLPSNWRRDGQENLKRKPAATMTWVAEVAAESSGSQVGSMIHINRFERQNVPMSFKKSTLDVTDAMFGPGPLPAGAPAHILTLMFSGHPARRYSRDFEVVLGGGMHQAIGPIAMRLEDIVIQTPSAYYVLEYRATKELFDKHYPAFERLAETFRLNKQRP